MAEWSQYRLKDIPFLAVPAIKINSNDIRANGTLYYADFALPQINEMLRMIRLESFPWIFLNTEGEALGNGKSAFMAHIYRTLEKERGNVLWAFARDDPRLTNLLSEILDAFVTQGKLHKIKGNLNSTTPEEIENVLRDYPKCNYGYKIIQGLSKVLSVEDHDLVRAFASMKRGNPTLHHGELFGALLHLSYACGEPRFTIFIDQFEEYVKAHKSTLEQSKLANEINDLLRDIGESVTFVVSTHPEVTNRLTTAAPEGDTFQIQNSSIRLPLMKSEDLFKMALLYFKAFRAEQFDGPDCFPILPEVVKYAIERTELNPRDLILALRSALLYGAINEFTIPIDEKFVSSLHYRIFGGLPNKVQEFTAGKWNHEIT